jgi:hypothetical protein
MRGYPRNSATQLSSPLWSGFGGFARAFNTLRRGHAELALELPAELGGAFVAHRPGGGAGVVAVVDHQTLRPVEADAFEILQRRVSRDELEIVMECRGAHAGSLRQVLDGKRLGRVEMDFF